MADERQLPDAAATEALGAALARALGPEGAVVYLQGELGAGKTTLVRGFLRALGYTGSVRSPTYTLLEPYLVEGRRVYHLDLYRIAEPAELEFLGVRELGERGDVCLIEWAERGAGALPPADLVLELAHAGPVRRLRWQAHSEAGRRLAGAACVPVLAESS
ncbi:MAG TPA: tRNA (adenosine(37)-N6)-threonylcarbamoyltransferase complex ATPase subunit type 1 TsaE [Gammaproteobacteria bacterium]|nr:tRNA (adenosine(37)-N6)-threonylcarbamoyltransferase complex ATPase subunit type 1 TsaE [Gammaproteobacteria bacterium]